MNVAHQRGTVSVLYPAPPQDGYAVAAEPSCFRDLNLNQICDAIVDGRDDYDLAPFFYDALRDVDAVRYRQEVMRDLEHADVLELVQTFAAGMGDVRKQLGYARKVRNGYQRQRWLLAALETYCRTVTRLDEDLSSTRIASQALRDLREFVFNYKRSPEFGALTAETQNVLHELSQVIYTVQVKDMGVTVDVYHDEPDLTAQVEQTFAKFRQGDVQDYRFRFADYIQINQVEERVLSMVAKLFPEQFQHLFDYCKRHNTSLNPTIQAFDREIQFYLAYMEYIQPLKDSGLEFSYPEVSTESKETNVSASFDLALAAKLVADRQPVICNDLSLSGEERVIVITGPNQGGKTTYSRMFGQLHHLAALGLTVPGSEARLFIPDQIFTHFEREEDLSTLRSKFEDELIRMREILDRATANSVLIMNESLTTTTLDDAVEVGSLVLREILESQMLCLFVTFVDELAYLSENVVSMMSTVDEEDPTIRTFRVIRKPADGLAHAVALANKYGLGYERLKERVMR